jgi:hypothetical protein
MTPNTALTREPIAIDECGDNNPAGLPAAEIQKLKAGGGSSAELRPLYPYDGTVFPRGMLAPDLMWEGPPADQAAPGESRSHRMLGTAPENALLAKRTSTQSSSRFSVKARP